MTEGFGVFAQAPEAGMTEGFFVYLLIKQFFSCLHWLSIGYALWMGWTMLSQC
jgi:hypothetical protein